MAPKLFLGLYLGVLFNSTTFTKRNLRHLLVKAEKKWIAGPWTWFGKIIVLIQSHLEVFPSYVMTTARLPTTITNSLDHINQNFFCKQSMEKKGIRMIFWDKICQPKNQEGLGFRKTEEVNSAFLAKLAWKIIPDHNNLWYNLFMLNTCNIIHFFCLWTPI